jgi:2-methylcitrate dehydratase PrpD
MSPGGLDSFLGQPFEIGDFPHGNAAFNYKYSVATALLRKSVRPEHFTEASIRDPQINAFISKIKLAEQPEADRNGVSLKIIMKDGRELTESCEVASGDLLNNPISRDELIAKFWGNVEFSQTVTKDNAEAVLALLEKLEDLDDVNRIVSLLVA